jgi:diguanylate cyclase (GGDEF)-like protein
MTARARDPEPQPRPAWGEAFGGTARHPDQLDRTRVARRSRVHPPVDIDRRSDAMTWLARLKRWLGVTVPAPQAQAQARRSYADELTHLSNRQVMHDTLVAALDAGVTGVVVMLDLDHFKYFNDRHGHRVGDELLRAVAGRLRETFTLASCLARANGDQFIAFLPGLSLAEAMRKVQGAVDAMRAPVTLASGSEIVTVSAGVATLAGPAVDDVWHACAAALHAAKARGRDRVVAFDDDTRQVVASRRDGASTGLELQVRNRALREEARTDALTGLRNRLALDELLHAAAGDGDRRVQRAALAFIDVDHFGNYNHVHGDAAGDDALRAVAHAIKACSREADFVFRKGGEEFVVILPDADNEAAVAAAERIRNAVQALALPHAASSTADVVTVTIGVASGPPGATLRQLLSAAAEKAMAGKVSDQRNRVHAVRLRDFGAAG